MPIIKPKVIDAEIVDEKQYQVYFPEKLLFIKELHLLLQSFFWGIYVVICLIGLILFAWSNPVLQTIFASIATYVIHNYVKVYVF